MDTLESITAVQDQDRDQFAARGGADGTLQRGLEAEQHPPRVGGVRDEDRSDSSSVVEVVATSQAQEMRDTPDNARTNHNGMAERALEGDFGDEEEEEEEAWTGRFAGEQVKVLSDGSVMNVDWSDGHSSTYEARWLRAHDNSPEALRQRESDSWPTPLRASDAIPEADGAAFMEDDKVVYGALREINRTGMCLLNNVGTAKGSVVEVARRIAPVSHEMPYGKTVHIVTQKDPRNVAYTTERLRLHMDLVYYESPPGLQLLHCLTFDDGVKGGESFFIDAFAAAAHFRKHNPEMFEVLSRVPATFCKIRGLGSTSAQARREQVDLEPAVMEYRKPHFQLDSSGALVTVTWSPIHEDVLVSAPEDIGPYYRAYRAFQRLVEEGLYAEEHTLRTRLKPGQCVVFNNRRLLHGREAFVEATGSKRKLEICFVNIDDALSRYRSLGRQHQDQHHQHHQQPSDHLKRFGNGTLIW